MSEQEQAEALAAWLSEPAGTPPPPGVDPEVLEAVYALQPERAPVPLLTVDDILGDVPQLAAGAPAAAEVPLLPEGQTLVSEAPSRLPSANRLAGFGVLLATAAALLLVLLPQGMSPEAGQAVMADSEGVEDAVAAAPPPPPMAKTREQEEIEEEPEAAADFDDAVAVAELDVPEAVPRDLGPGVASEALDAQRDEADDFGDAVADLGAEVVEMPDGRSFGSEGMIPELEDEASAISGGVVGGVVSEEPALGNRGVRKSSRPARAVAQAPALVEPMAEDAPSEAKASTDTVAVRPAALSGVGPDSSWEDSLDANSLSLIKDALAIASTEAQRGRPRRAAVVLGPWVAPPVSAGHHCAAQAAVYYLQAGLPREAAQTALRGIQLGQGGGSSTVWLWAVYGDALAAQGSADEANASWNTAVSLMGAGG